MGGGAVLKLASERKSPIQTYRSRRNMRYLLQPTYFERSRGRKHVLRFA
jgi:hypothetical protein